ncbi:MAG: hypothetical protein Q9227_004372 [Pyrenula ochraceoflavens]
MAGNRARRMAKELADIHNDQACNVHAEAISDDLMALKGSFDGPPSSPYAGGKFEISIVIPTEYPFRPPVMKFKTKIWHPNVSSETGAICLDTLSTGWSPVFTIKSALLSLQSLLSTPEPKDPQDAVVAGMMIKNPKEFERVARDWAVKYAGAPRDHVGEGSGNATKESIEAAEKENEEREEEAEMAA